MGTHCILPEGSWVQIPWHSVSGPVSSGSHGSWNVCVWHLPVSGSVPTPIGSGPGCGAGPLSEEHAAPNAQRAATTTRTRELENMEISVETAQGRGAEGS